MVQASNVPSNFIRKLIGLGPANTDVILAVAPDMPADSLRLVKDANLPNELLAMEERQVIRSYKFGLLYAGPDQSLEEEFFRNTLDKTSEGFKQFLNFLGEKIELKGWKGYRAGLDVENGQTGQYSYYTKWQGYEVMFHVSPLLPYHSTDPQQVEKKRHIGNDIVVIVYQDSDLPLKMNSFSSKQNHVLAIVKPVNKSGKPGEIDGYNLTIINKAGVPSYKPDLPEPAYFDRSAVSRDFFIHKLVNGERASYKSPSFAPKISRTRSVLLYDVAERFLLR